MKEKNLVQKIADAVFFDGGFTWAKNGVVPKNGYAVAVKNLFVGKEQELYRLNSFLNKAISTASDNFVVGWLDFRTGLIYIDMIEIYNTEKKALDKARAINEIAIYDLKNNKEIRVI